MQLNDVHTSYNIRFVYEYYSIEKQNTFHAFYANNKMQQLNIRTQIFVRPTGLLVSV